MSKTQFPTQQERLKSLQQWNPGFSKEHLEDIADSGFSFFNESDDPGRLRCVYCRLPVSNWKSDDDPWEVHLSSANEICPYIKLKKGMDFIRSKLDGCSLNVNEAALRQETHLLVGFQNSASAHEQNAGKNRSVRTENVHIYDMADAEKRNESFEEACNHLEVLSRKRNELVRSGFFFEGLGPKRDSVRCYSCSWTMCSITKEDDIWKEHAQKFTCNHVIKTKGLEFVLAARKSSSNNNKPVLCCDKDTVIEDMVTENCERYKRRSAIMDQPQEIECSSSDNSARHKIRNTQPKQCRHHQEEETDIGNEDMVTENSESYKRRSAVMDQPEERESSSSDNGAWHKRRCTRSIQIKDHQDEETGMKTDGISNNLGFSPNNPSQWEMPYTEVRNAVKFRRRRRIPSGDGRDWTERETIVYLCCCAVERRDREAMPCSKCGKNLHFGNS